MRKSILAGAAAAALAFSGVSVAQQPIQKIEDPTPNGAFTGTYDCSYYTYDEAGTATKVEKTCQAKGYVAVYQDGVVACNGNQAVTRPDNGEPLQGYIWVGSAHRAKGSVTQQDPTGNVGAGNNLATDDPATKDKQEQHGPCE